MILGKSNVSNLYFIALYLVAFCISLPFFFGSLSIIILAICWLLQGNFKKALLQFRKRKILWFWVLFFLLHCFSYFYSQDKNESVLDIGRKLSFIILPFIAGTGTSLKRENVKKLFQSYVLGVAAIAVFCIIRSTVIFFQQGTISHFFYHQLVIGFDTNAVYYAWYCFFSLILLMLFNWDIKKEWRWPYRFIVCITILFFLLLSARTLIALFLLIVIPAYLYKKMNSGQWKIENIVKLLSVIFIILIFLISIKNPIRKRYEDILNQSPVTNLQSSPKVHFNNLTLRLFLWRTSLENVVEHNLWWYGCGNGDVHRLQQQKIFEYKNVVSEWDIKEGHLSEYNIHNMYLQILLMLGLPGLLCFLILVIMPFFIVKDSEYALIILSFQIVAFFFMFQESALQSQAGIVFFCFFEMVFLNICYALKEAKITNAELLIKNI